MNNPIDKPSRDEIIGLLGLSPLPDEGGWYRQTYRSEAEYADGRAASTAIYYFLDSDPDCFSAIHRLPSDEIWHYYVGDPVRLVILEPHGSTKEITLGNDLTAEERVQYVVPAGVWFGAHLLPGGKYALMGTTMAPGFEFSDYEEGSRADLVCKFPQAADDIVRLTRV
ncbi:MAG: cupin domain-containing protein [Spirochaetia bacterium]